MTTLQQLLSAIFARSQIKATPQIGLGSIVEQRHASPARKQRRQIIAQLGRRQGIKWIKHIRAQRRANRDELAQLG